MGYWLIHETAVNYRLKADDIRYIFEHSEVDMIIVDHEYVPMLRTFRDAHPTIPILIDTDSSNADGPFDKAVVEGLQFDAQTGKRGWTGLQAQAPDENGMIAISYTSGTTSRPKGVIYSHRGCYMASLSNVVESGLNHQNDRCKYLWVLPMFHALGS
jgi:long-subunit acyl-CoA synthetase (AMP-forming)